MTVEQQPIERQVHDYMKRGAVFEGCIQCPSYRSKIFKNIFIERGSPSVMQV